MSVIDDHVLQDMAHELLNAMSDDKTVDKQLLKTAESLITSHHFYVQLLFVSMVIDRMKKMDMYMETMDLLAEDISSEDIAEMTPIEKVRALQAFTGSVKYQLETVQTMLASKDASGVLVASLRETFAGEADFKNDREEAQDIISGLQSMKPDQRQRILKGTIQALRDLAIKEKSTEEQ